MRATPHAPLDPSLATFPALSKNLSAFRRTLLRWYHLHQRDLPWRHNRDPYRIWLSEIMLQQTRVAAVLDHYRVFLERFPTVHALAAASEDEVLAAWSGLGYYRRARMLHRCAATIVERHDGRFPQTAEALLALPGIGRYTAAAIASIAFCEPVAVVDGNVERVLQRVTGVNLNSVQTWRYAEEFLVKSRPGDFNQAMMELGATLCVPRAPHCKECPIRKWCATRGEVPHTPSRLRQKQKQSWCSLQERNGKGHNDAGANGNNKRAIRLVRRARKATLMPGMWELPQSSDPPQPLPHSAVWRTFRHSITITDYTVHVLRNTSAASKPSLNTLLGAKGKWIATDRIPHIPITGLTRKILKAGGII
jgi:A/G-specific adenine glycosylase